MFNPFAAIEKAFDLALTVVILASVAAIAIVIGILTLYVSNNSAISVIATFVAIGLEFKIITYLVN